MRYVIGVASNQAVTIVFAQDRINVLLGELDADVRVRLSCGEGAKGPRLYDWAAVRLNCPIAGQDRVGRCRPRRRTALDD